jgi:imidazolonepropionase-like amidohydrolase
MPVKKTPIATGPVDAHVHLRDRTGPACAAAAGVAAIRDAGSKDGAGLGCTKPGASGDVPAVLSAGWALFSKGGYGSAFGVSVGSTGQIKSQILRLKATGAGIIKVVASGMVSLEDPGAITPGGLERDAIAFAVLEARRLGLGVMAHANGEAAIIASAEAGVRSLEHGFFMTGRALDLMAKKKIFWVPTVGALARAAERAGGQARTFVEGLIREHLAMIRRAYAIGVPLAVGTDCVLPDPRYKEAYAAELAYFEQAGIPREDVMKIASEGGAELLGFNT